MQKNIGFLLVALLSYIRASHGLETIHAANFNGNNHTDSLGINYTSVTLGKSERYSQTYTLVPKADYSLYQTIAYDRTLNYNIPVDGSGHFLLIVKFVAWGSWSSSFQMLLNGQHAVRSNFTWFDSTSKKDVAYDHYVYFSVCGDVLQYQSEESVIRNNQIQVSISNRMFYTSMSAVAVLKGEVEQVPVLETAQIFSDADRWGVYDHVCNETETAESTTETTSEWSTSSNSTESPTSEWTTSSSPGNMTTISTSRPYSTTSSARPPPSTSTAWPPTSTSTAWPPTSTSTTLRPSTTTRTTPRPPSPTPTSPPPKSSPQIEIVNHFNTFINHIVKNYNFNFIVNKKNRTLEIPAEVFE